MADSKITALTALTAADPANDMIPIVDVSDTPPASGNTKRISINNILACSPTATLASATITGDLTVDTSTLKVDSANNRVGIGTATPANPLHISGTNPVPLLLQKTGSTDVYLSFTDSSGVFGYFGFSNGDLRFQTPGQAYANKYVISSDGTSTWSNVGGVAGTAMTLNSTGLGVGGTAIGTKLEVVTSTSGSIGGTATVTNSAATAIGNAASLNFRTNSNFLAAGYFGARIEAVTPAASNSTDLVFYNYKGVTNSGDETMRITSVGNVGIGVTPIERLTVAGTASVGGTGNIGVKFHSGNPVSGNLAWLLSNDSANSNILNLYYYNAGVFSGRAFVVNQSGNFMVRTPSTPPTIPDNEMMVFNLTSNTNLRISVKGTDGTVRTANITLA